MSSLNKVLSRLSLPLLLLVGAFVANTFCTVPSLLLSNVFHLDQSAFYMLGRSVAHGLVPYVDVADVKGPVLYLIFALGYIISPEKGVGISLLLTLSTWVVLLVSCRTLRVLGLSRDQAVAASLFSLLFLFNNEAQDFGGRGEDFIKPALAFLLYGLVEYCVAVSRAQENRARALRLLGWIIGSGAVWVGCIKYNNVVPFVLVGGMVAFYEFCRFGGRGVLPFVGRCMAGACVLLLPVSLYLWSQGALGACWEVYVSQNIQSYSRMHMFGVDGKRIWEIASRLLQSSASIPLFAVCATLLFFRFFSEGRTDIWLRALVLGLVLGSYAVNLAGISVYYLAACSPLGILCLVPVARCLPVSLSARVVCLYAALVLFATVTCNMSWKYEAPGLKPQREVESLLQAEELLSTVPHARIMYGYLDLGLGKKIHALPACRFWMGLNGETREMHELRLQTIRERKADFCIIAECVQGILNPTLETSGYAPVLEIPYVEPHSSPEKKSHMGRAVIWRKPDL